MSGFHKRLNDNKPYFPEVDVQYLGILHECHNGLPERIKIEKLENL